MSNPILPPTSPAFLTEAIFAQAGFFTGSANSWQIQAAFAIAENQIALEVGTFFTPTQFSVSYPYVQSYERLRAPVGKLISIDNVIIYERYTNNVDRLISGTAMYLDKDNGFFTIERSQFDTSSCSQCSGLPIGGYRVDVTMTAGYITGTSANPLIQVAMCMAADTILKMLYDQGALEEPNNQFINTSQIGRSITTISNRFILDGPLGVGGRAQYIRSLIRPYKIVRSGGLGK